MSNTSQSRINHFIITVPALMVFVSFFLFWFSIVNPVPTGDINTSVFSISGYKAASTLAGFLKVEGARELLNTAPKTDAGVWLGVLGACARFNATALDCASPSGNPQYNRFFVDYLATIVGNPVLVEQGIFTLHYDIPAVSPIVFFVSFVLLVFGWVLFVIATFPFYGGNFNKAGPFSSIGRKFNQIEFVYNLKTVIVAKHVGKTFLRLSVFMFSMAWLLGFTASLSHRWQWQAVRDAFNPIYAMLLAQALTTFPPPDAMPQLVAANIDSAAYTYMWVLWSFVAYTILAAIGVSTDYPRTVDDPFLTTEDDKSYSYKSNSGSTQKVHDVELPETGFIKAMPFTGKSENLNHLLV